MGFNELFSQLHAFTGYVARQTNPLTGAPLPQPHVGLNSAGIPEPPPPTPGQLSREQ